MRVVDIVWWRSRSECMSFDHLQMPTTAGWISNRVGMNDCSVGFASYFALFSVCSTSESALRLFCFAIFCLAIFVDYQLFNLLSLIFFGRKIFVGHLVRHSGVFSCWTFWKKKFVVISVLAWMLMYIYWKKMIISHWEIEIQLLHHLV